MEDSVWEQNLFHFKPEAFNWEHLSVGKSFILKEGNFILKDCHFIPLFLQS